MAESRESQHSLLSESDLITARPQRTWNPLGRSSPYSPGLDYAYIPHSHESFSEEVFREVGLGITNTSSETLPAHDKPGLISRTNSQPFTPSVLKTPQETPAISQRPFNCPSRSTVLQRRLSWIPMTILVLALYSTVFSGLYLAVAIRKPRWSNLGSGAPLAASTANLLCAFFAKTIELAYVTICVAFLGQVLSRRALMKDSRGVSIADMSMRAWIMQPGSMIVHWETLRYSGLTFLGVIALIATFVGMLYTTAAEALVSPKLSMGPTESTTLWGQVYASWGNPEYLAYNCQTPVPNWMDPLARNTTCLQMEHVGQAYHNFEQWLTTWTNLVEGGNETSIELRSRPQPTGLLWDNTTVTGSWIEINNITELSSQHGRMVNNITMAMPHSGIPGAAMDSKNHIPQPQDATGNGKYSIEASVPSPTVNVLCVGMTKSELSPLVYSEWPNAHFNAARWSVAPPADIPNWPSWLNRTVVDDLFSFGPQHGQRPPVFGTYPQANNTILNTTGLWPANAIYLLGKPNTPNPPYVMCSIRGKETGVCSTRYDAASSGAFLASNCENTTNPLQYNRKNPHFLEGDYSPDYKNVASEWASALSLGSGITTSQASTERLLMQMVSSYSASSNTYTLSPTLPSISEALAVMAGCTLLLSSQHAPFSPGWNYTPPPDILSDPVYEHFPASLQKEDYASGGTETWQGVFYVILVFAFLTSAVCLGFMIIEARGHQITDFTEPQNLFALAVNSSPSEKLRGACGGGPVGRQLNERWVVGMEEGDAHCFIRARGDGDAVSPFGSSRVVGEGGYARLEELEVEEEGERERERMKDQLVSPAVEEFRRISRRESFLARFY